MAIENSNFCISAKKPLLVHSVKLNDDNTRICIWYAERNKSMFSSHFFKRCWNSSEKGLKNSALKRVLGPRPLRRRWSAPPFEPSGQLGAGRGKLVDMEIDGDNARICFFITPRCAYSPTKPCKKVMSEIWILTLHASQTQQPKAVNSIQKLNVRYPNLKRNEINYKHIQTHSNILQQNSHFASNVFTTSLHFSFDYTLQSTLYSLVCYKWATCGESCVTNSPIILSAPKH